MTATATRDSLVIRGMGGLGDGIYQRPLLHAACERFESVYLETPWPELYRDLPVRPTRYTADLRTQQKNVARQSSWHMPPENSVGHKAARIQYGSQALREGLSIIEAMEETLPFRADPFRFDLPDFGPPPGRIDAPLAVIRPATVRSEWRMPARNPDPVLIIEATAILRELGFFTILVADLELDREWLEGPKPEANREYLKGEMGVDQLCALVAAAAVVVTPVGFAVPMAMAYRTPCIVLAGGALKWNHPGVVHDRRIQAPVEWIMPDRPCYCEQRDHACVKTVTDFPEKFRAAVGRIGR